MTTLENKLDPNALDIATVNELIRGRRSVYPHQYSGEAIDRQHLEILLENANWAPTHKFTQPWFFKVFSQGGRDGLLDKMIEIIKASPLSPGLDAKVKKFEMFKTKVSHIMAIVMRRDPQKSLPEVEEMAAVACAVQNIYLSLGALGLGGYWSTGGGTYSPEMHRYLNLEEGDKCLGFFYLGKYSGPRLPGKRKPVEDKVQWIKKAT